MRRHVPVRQTNRMMFRSEGFGRALRGAVVGVWVRVKWGGVMVEWNVYVGGRYVGTVHEVDEDAARCAACSKFDFVSEAEISVSRR